MDISNIKGHMDSLLHGTGLLRTKDGIKEEDIQLTKELHEIESSYITKYEPIKDLSDKYTECKSDMFVFRYKSLKEMIKECISAYETLQKEEKKPRDRRQGGAGAFLEIATETNRVLSEIEPLRKAELIKDIEEKKIKMHVLKGKFKLLDNAMEKLKTDYVASKQHAPTKRYTLLKDMIKQIVRAENLVIASKKTQVTFTLPK